MNREKILSLIAKKEARKAELNTPAASCEVAAELRSLNQEMTELHGELAELRGILD